MKRSDDPMVEIMRSAIVKVIEEMDPPPDDEVIVTKNGIAMMNMEMFHKLTNGQYRNDLEKENESKEVRP